MSQNRLAPGLTILGGGWMSSLPGISDSEFSGTDGHFRILYHNFVRFYYYFRQQQTVYILHILFLYTDCPLYTGTTYRKGLLYMAALEGRVKCY